MFDTMDVWDDESDDEEFEYQCAKCGSYFEATEGSEEGAERTCRPCLDEDA